MDATPNGVEAFISEARSTYLLHLSNFLFGL